MVLLTSLAIEAAESLVEVLLVLHTRSVLSKGEVFVFIAGPLRCWKFCCVTNQPDEERGHQHLRRQEEKRGRGTRQKLCITFLYPQHTDAPTHAR